MITHDLIDLLRRELPDMELVENEPMSRHCSFRIGGPAAAMAVPRSVEELSRLLALLAGAKIRPLVIGNGTNLLVTDSPLDRIVIRLGEKLSHMELEGEDEVYSLAGVTLARLAAFCAENSLTGLEFAHGIPGTLGGAVCMNAGAYGGEMKDVLKSVEYLDAAGALRQLPAEELNLSYRHSIFSDSDKIVVGCRLKLQKGSSDKIKEQMRLLAEKRRSSQPLDRPSAGSTFKRPQGGYAAALIEQAGLKGFSIGGAQVSEKHSGFVINTGEASFADVTALMKHIEKTVYNNSGILLEPEVKIIQATEE